MNLSEDVNKLARKQTLSGKLVQLSRQLIKKLEII